MTDVHQGSSMRQKACDLYETTKNLKFPASLCSIWGTEKTHAGLKILGFLHRVVPVQVRPGAHFKTKSHIYTREVARDRVKSTSSRFRKVTHRLYLCATTMRPRRSCVSVDSRDPSLGLGLGIPATLGLPFQLKWHPSFVQFLNIDFKTISQRGRGARGSH